MKSILTQREVEILKLILQELPSAEIASLLNLSIRTIDTHRKNICRKSNTKTMVGLMKYAIKEGFLEGFYYHKSFPKNTHT